MTSHWVFWALDLVKSFNEGGPLYQGFLSISPIFCPVPSGNRDDTDFFRLVADLLQEITDFLLNFAISLFGVVDGFFVNLVEQTIINLAPRVKAKRAHSLV